MRRVKSSAPFFSMLYTSLLHPTGAHSKLVCRSLLVPFRFIGDPLPNGKASENFSDGILPSPKAH